VTSDCARLREVAPELALGVLVGAERGQALAHLAGCAECRHFVDEMSEVADSLLLLSADAEPPLGFESRVVARLAAGHPRRRRWRWIATAAAAVVLAAVATGIAVHHNDDRSGDGHVRTAALVGKTGKDAGDVYVMEGQPAWVVMAISSKGAGRTYLCELNFRDGRVVRAGQFTVPDHDGWWGIQVADGVDGLQSVRLLALDGTMIASAEFD
jgi:predicted anti-sigma-YlaC factor YlaD